MSKVCTWWPEQIMVSLSPCFFLARATVRRSHRFPLLLRRHCSGWSGHNGAYRRNGPSSRGSSSTDGSFLVTSLSLGAFFASRGMHTHCSMNVLVVYGGTLAQVNTVHRLRLNQPCLTKCLLKLVASCYQMILTSWGTFTEVRSSS